MKVILQKFYNHIIAPDYCPYKEEIPNVYGNEVDKRDIVSPILCSLCKICDFVPGGNIVIEEPTKDDREKFVKYLTQINIKVSTAISGQFQYLSKKDRLPIALFISPVVFNNMLDYVYVDNPKKQKVFEFFLKEETPICYIIGCPVYLSRKLTKTPAQLVGEANWK